MQRDITVSVQVLGVFLTACQGASDDRVGEEGALEFLLTAESGAGAPLPNTPLAAGDRVTIELSPLGEPRVRTVTSTDPDVLAIDDVEGISVCSTFTLIGPCDRVPTGDSRVFAHTGRPGFATLEAWQSDGSLVDRVAVEVREVVGFAAVGDEPWRFVLGEEPTNEVVPVDEDGLTLWMGTTARWTAVPEDLVLITSEHRDETAHAVRAVAREQGRGALVVRGPGDLSTALPIVVE